MMANEKVPGEGETGNIINSTMAELLQLIRDGIICPDMSGEIEYTKLNSVHIQSRGLNTITNGVQY
jgi:hypothetical protein